MHTNNGLGIFIHKINILGVTTLPTFFHKSEKTIYSYVKGHKEYM